MSQILKLCVILLVMLIGVAFHLVNDQSVELNYYLGMIELPFSFVVAAAVCLGAVLGILASLPILFRLKRENYKLGKQVQVGERELNNLRTIPIKDNF